MYRFEKYFYIVRNRNAVVTWEESLNFEIYTEISRNVLITLTTDSLINFCLAKISRIIFELSE